MHTSTKMTVRILFILAMFISVNSFAQQNDIAKNNMPVPSNAVWTAKVAAPAFTIAPASVSKKAAILIDADTDGWATFQVLSDCGTILLEQQMVVSKGFNKIPVFFISELEKGVYSTVLKVEDKTFFSKLTKE